jgi:hypothetical protein
MDEFRLNVFINMKDNAKSEIVRCINLDRAGDIIETRGIKSTIDVCIFTFL